nr:winged helix-turn-helix domain-containing protein [Micromonospora sp. 15K316]
MTEVDESTVPDGPDPAEELYPLVIAVTPSPAERLRLAERLDGIAPLLLVADFDELRRLIAVPGQLPASAPAPPPPGLEPAGDALLIDSPRSAARYGGQEISLTRLEHDLLICLTAEPLRVWSYAELHRSVWRNDGQDRKADVQSLVKRLRRKLGELGTGITIDAVRGVGLRLTDHRQPRVGGG